MEGGGPRRKIPPVRARHRCRRPMPTGALASFRRGPARPATHRRLAHIDACPCPRRPRRQQPPTSHFAPRSNRSKRHVHRRCRGHRPGPYPRRHGRRVQFSHRRDDDRPRASSGKQTHGERKGRRPARRSPDNEGRPVRGTRGGAPSYRAARRRTSHHLRQRTLGQRRRVPQQSALCGAGVQNTRAAGAVRCRGPQVLCGLLLARRAEDR